MLHKGKPRIFDASKSASHSRTPSTFTISKSPHLAKKNKLHSKSTYFYRWGSSSKLSSKLTYVVPSVCGLALLVGGIVAINPLLNSGDSKVYASVVSGSTSGADDDSSDNTPAVSLTITPNTSDSTNGNVTVGEPAYFSNTITVGGSSISQYSLTLNTASGSSGELVGQDNPYATVGKVSSNTPTTNFPDNTWGYAISTANTTPDKTTLTYNPVPGTDSNNSAFLDFQKNLSGTVNNTYKLIFAAKLGTGMPADHYTTDVYLSAVASATETVENWFRSTARITTMQEMNSTICNNAPEHATSQLTDSRDGKLYWVAKLKDGNCWMTQNLDYDGGGDVITVYDWPGQDYSGVFWGYNNPGNYIYNIGPNGNNGSCDSTGPLGCPTQFSPINSSDTNLDNQEKLHYHIGNYYSWPAATNSKTTTTDNIQGICPSDWSLPISSDSNNTKTGSFYYLLSKYGLQSSSTGTGIDGKSYQIYNSPLYFIYGGDLSNGKLNGVGYSGYYWSSTGNNPGYSLYFGSSSVNPSYISSYTYYYYFGSSVRCVFIPE